MLTSAQWIYSFSWPSFRRNSIFRKGCRKICSTFETLERRDCPAGFSLSAVVDTVTEGNAAHFQVRMDQVSPIPQTVLVSSRAITATLGTDYMHRTQRLTFSPGQTVKSFFVQSLVDPHNAAEGSETLRILVNPVGGTPTELSALMTIEDYVPVNPYNISFAFDGTVPGTMQAQFQAAADRWENVIIGDLPDVTLPSGQVIDDLQINVSVVTTLPATTIAEANFTDIRIGNTGLPADGDFTSNGLPYIGEIVVNSFYVDAIGLTNTLAHEIGHVIGFGTLWSNDVGTYPNLVSDYGGPDPAFLGPNAIREYNEIFLNSPTATDVPLYAVGAPGDGSYGVHWRDSVFNDYPTYGELMTAIYPVTGNAGQVVPSLLSRITVGAMDDLGYTVNYAGADAYFAPSTGASSRVSGLVSAETAGARAMNSTHAETFRSSQKRTLPARITFPGEQAVILEDNDASRVTILTSLGLANDSTFQHIPPPPALSKTSPSSYDLRHLPTEQKLRLAAWAGYDTSELDRFALSWFVGKTSSSLDLSESGPSAGKGQASLFAEAGLRIP